MIHLISFLFGFHSISKKLSSFSPLHNIFQFLTEIVNHLVIMFDLNRYTWSSFSLLLIIKSWIQSPLHTTSPQNDLSHLIGLMSMRGSTGTNVGTMIIAEDKTVRPPYRQPARNQHAPYSMRMMYGLSKRRNDKDSVKRQVQFPKLPSSMMMFLRQQSPMGHHFTSQHNKGHASRRLRSHHQFQPHQSDQTSNHCWWEWSNLYSYRSRRLEPIPFHDYILLWVQSKRV